MILAGVEPSASTNTLLFRMDRARSISEIMIANRSTPAVNIRVWVLPTNTTLDNKYAWAYDISIPANSTLGLLEGNLLPLSLGEEVWIFASAVRVSFNLVGQ